jgi:PhzF family phenazine biosynthesis protein
VSFLPLTVVDVFTTVAFRGNPVAVVHGADGLDDERMAAFARWTNLSETVFLLAPDAPEADWRLRIFTPETELPFAGHPTLGAAHAWLERGGAARGAELVQQCAAGLIRLRRDGDRLAFAAPPLRRSGAVEAGLLERLARGLGVEARAIVAANWVDNGPGWVAVMLPSRDEVLAVRPDATALAGLNVGVVAPWADPPPGEEARFEVRAFPVEHAIAEDPVTGSLNAGLAQWLIGAGLAPPRYVASQGTAMGRAGRVHVARDENGATWVGGACTTRIEGRASFAP